MHGDDPIEITVDSVDAALAAEIADAPLEELLSARHAPLPVAEPPAELVETESEKSEEARPAVSFPTHTSGKPLNKYRVSALGHPDLEGKAVDESEAIRAYRQHLGISGDKPRTKSLNFTVERIG